MTVAEATLTRFRRSNPCPICGGGDDMPRGRGQRCCGYLSSDGRFAYCTREEFAGLALLEDTDPPSYRHILEGECRCGVTHSPARSLNGNEVARYDYVDETGALIFQVVRYANKQFRQRRPGPGGEWIWNLNATPRVLYRLPAVLGAAHAGETIYVVEGEKDVHAIEKAGAVATCNPGGAGKWKPDYAEYLAGARVVVVADNDEPGLAHALQVAESLPAAAVSVVRAAAGKDAADHLAEGLTLDQFIPVAPSEDTADRFTLTPLTARDLCAEPDTGRGHLLGPLVLAGGRTIIVGDTGEGKTTLALQIVRTILEGDDFLGYAGDGVGRALIVDLEQGRRTVKRALRDAQLSGRDDVDLVLVPDGLSLDRDPEHLRELERVLATQTYTLVVLDPYYKAHRAEEPNAERPIVDLMRILDSLRAAYGFALILPAHPRKEPPGAGSVRKLTIHDVAGSGAVTRGAEVVLGIERVSYGLARLRYLKDREGDLPVGEAWNLIYSKADGFARDPKDNAPARDYPQELREHASDHVWRTLKEHKDLIGAGEEATRNALNSLLASGEFEYAVGPPGRNSSAKCWRSSGALTLLGHPGAVGAPTNSNGDTALVPSPICEGTKGQGTQHRLELVPPAPAGVRAEGTEDPNEPHPDGDPGEPA